MKKILFLSAALFLFSPYAKAQNSADDVRSIIRTFYEDISSCNYTNIFHTLDTHPKLANLHSLKEDYNTPLVEAIENNCLAAAKILVSSGANVNLGNEIQRKYPLILAAEKQRTGDDYDWPDFIAEIAPYALGTKVDISGETALIKATKNFLPYNVEVILNNCVTPGINIAAYDDYNAIMWTAVNNDLESAGLIINADGIRNKTVYAPALEIAQKMGYVQMQNLLMPLAS